MKVLRYFGLIVFLCGTLPAHAALTIEIMGAGENQIPIAIVPFAGEEKLAQSISEIVAADLARSGMFRLVDAAGKMPHEPSEVVYADWAGLDALLIGHVKALPNGINMKPPVESSTVAVNAFRYERLANVFIKC